MAISTYKLHLIIILIAWGCVHLSLFLIFGFRVLFDAEVYLRGADYLIAHGKLEDSHHIFYSVHIGIIALSRLISAHTVAPVIIFQIILSGLATILLYKSSVKLFNNPLAGLFSALIFICWVDCIHWNLTLMSESLFCSLCLILIYVLADFQGRKSDFLKLTGLLVLLFFTRPASVVVITGVIAFLMVFYGKQLKSLSLVKKSTYGFLLLFLFLASAILLFQKWDFSVDYLTGNIVSYMNITKGTPTYVADLQIPLEPSRLQEAEKVTGHSWGILNMLHFMYEYPGHILKTGALKVFYLLSFYRPYYTWEHNVFNMIWLAVVYACFIVGIIKSCKNAIKTNVLVVIFVNCMLIAIATVDWDNRFYIPMEPGIVLFAGFGAMHISRFFLLFYKNDILKIVC
ncbi:hypothetical protein C900_05566 [Fulvivirga imtechensis AK7]|uniref:Glycosyltransferase RgtA/B/C/D-like domain-containing protein n=1 Tax=Fulvivirga imtechensis AK7 TaxID=1237149 RepID=L8JL90_9BACT|nr:hypothetical protein [Fulvivirga imtechensis]ELR69008.1 hypothetical protein C900_05566 [Fulvivirga imtechensis AK7]